MLASVLRQEGYNIRFIDCLDVYHPEMYKIKGVKPPKRRAFGTGKFWKQTIPKPPQLAHIDRPYSRYGIHPDVFRAELKTIPKPDAILVTSLMTYWYPGVVETIQKVRGIFPDVPVILGGIYARLCADHARARAGADYVIESSDLCQVLDLLTSLGLAPETPSLSSLPPFPPAFDLLRKVEYVCILTSTGCPYRCRYCANPFLFPKFEQRSPDEVFAEIQYWHDKFGVKDFAFYDDALLVGAQYHFIPLMEMVLTAGLKVRFHTPNAIHIREVSPAVARLMKQTGFETIRVGLETADFHLRQKLDNKLRQGEFEKGVKNLFDAGFKPPQIGAYILVGLPGQSVESVEATIDFVSSRGVMPYLAEYSPLPHTDLWQEAVKASEYDLENEPLFHNNTLLPCWEEAKRAELPRLKQKVREIRKEKGQRRKGKAR